MLRLALFWGFCARSFQIRRPNNNQFKYQNLGDGWFISGIYARCNDKKEGQDIFSCFSFPTLSEYMLVESHVDPLPS